MMENRLQNEFYNNANISVENLENMISKYINSNDISIIDNIQNKINNLKLQNMDTQEY